MITDISEIWNPGGSTAVLMVFVLSAAILLVTAFSVKPKRLHLFEIIAICLAVVVINSPAYSYFVVNQKWMTVPKSRELAMVRIVYSEILNPLFFAWALDWILPWKRRITRLAGYVALLSVLMLGGWFLHRWGVIHFRPAGRLYYVPLKMILLMAALGSAGFIRFLMRKDGVALDPVPRG